MTGPLGVGDPLRRATPCVPADCPNPELGWSAFHEMRDEIDKGLEINFKMANLQPKIEQSLEITGMLEYLDVFATLEEALASF